MMLDYPLENLRLTAPRYCRIAATLARNHW